MRAREVTPVVGPSAGGHVHIPTCRLCPSVIRPLCPRLLTSVTVITMVRVRRVTGERILGTREELST